MSIAGTLILDGVSSLQLYRSRPSYLRAGCRLNIGRRSPGRLFPSPKRILVRLIFHLKIHMIVVASMSMYYGIGTEYGCNIIRGEHVFPSRFGQGKVRQ